MLTRFVSAARGQPAAAGAATGRLTNARRMAARFGFAIADQALFAGTSFAFTLLLGRWATPEAFGAFSIALSVSVLLQNIFDGLVSEPLAVYGADRLSRQLDAYIGRLLVAHIFITGVLAGVAMLIALVLNMLHQSEVAKAFLGMGIATPFLLCRVLTRQPLYITGRIHWSAVTGFVYLVCSLAALWLLQSLHLVTPLSAFLALAFGSLVCSAIVVLVFLKPVWRTADAALSSRRLFGDHVAYGGWAVGERLLSWLQGNVLFLELPLVANLHASAVYRVVSVLAMPAFMMISTITSVLLPALVRVQASQGQATWVKWLIPGAMAVAVPYGVLLVAFGHGAAHLAFAGQYDADLNQPLLIAIGIGPAVAAVSVVLELQLRARLMVRQVLVARIAATGMLLLVGVALVARYQVLGAALAFALTWLTTSAVHIILNHRRNSAADPGAGMSARRHSDGSA